MSTAMPSNDQAMATIQLRIRGPVFFEKLASSYGIQPQTEEEAVKYLQMADKLRVLYDRNQEKVASAQASVLTQADQRLDSLLGQPTSAAAPRHAVKTAAQRLAQDPEIVNAALALMGVAQPAA